MIVVVGMPAWRAADPPGPAGRACSIALAVAAHGAAVELVGRAGDDPAGDSLMIALARAGVGHAAILRDPARPTPVLEAAATDESQASVAADDVPDDRAPALADAPTLEAADVALATQYLTDFTVLVVTDDVPAAILPAALEAAAFAEAHLVLLLAADAAPPDDLPHASTVLAAPATDLDGAFAGVVGGYAAALDGGTSPAQAFAEALALGWERPLPGGTTN